MSRSDAFDAFYGELRPRLLHQTYAFCGDAAVADDAVAEAFTSASQHWRTVSHEPDREAWMRRAAFSASRRGRPEHPPTDGLLRELQDLASRERHLVIATTLGGADVPDAAREVGITVSRAESERDAALGVLASGAEAVSPAQALADVTSRLDTLRGDLDDVAGDKAASLRRLGNRRRRTRTGLATLCTAAVAIAAGAVTAGTLGPESREKTAPPSPSAPASSLPLPPVGEAELVTARKLERLDVARNWRVVETAPNPTNLSQIDSCLSTSIDPELAEQVWTREYTAPGKQNNEAFQIIVNESTVRAGRGLYRQVLEELTTCPSRQVRAYYVVRGAGDAASELQQAYVDGNKIKANTVALQRSGETVSLLLVRTPLADAPNPRRLKTLIAWFNDQACPSTEGTCNELTTTVTEQDPPPDPTAPGFISAADIPLLPGVARPWAGTQPVASSNLGAATLCQTADVSDSQARELQDRAYVIPDARRLPTLFGLTQTTAKFPTAKRADTLANDIATALDECPQTILSVRAGDDGEIDVGPGADARWWTFTVRYGDGQQLVIRTAIVRVRKDFTQLTFTPGSADLDMTDREFRSLVKRSAARLAQA